SVGSPFAKPHFAHVHRVNPRRSTRLGNFLARKRFHSWLKTRPRTGRIGAHDWIERRFQLAEERFVESRSDSSGVDQRSVDVVGELQRAETTATFLRLG